MGKLRTPKRKSARLSAGLTLIELMVVVAIAAIILGLAAPSFSEYIITQRLRSVHGEVATQLQFARSEAVARSAFVGVRFQESTPGVGLTCYIIFTRPDPTTSTDVCDCTAAPGARCNSSPTTTTELRTVTIPGELKVGVRTPTGQTDTITFDARSAGLKFAPSDFATLTANAFQVDSSASGGRSLRILVLPSGRPKLCTPSGSILGGSTC
jgi:prepilin-type N-terminal cleavage/methylation domain-containing protein